MFFSYKNVPEAEGMTEDQIITMTKHIRPKSLRQPLTIGGIAILAIMVYVGIFLIGGALGGALGGGLGGAIYSVMNMQAIRPMITEYRKQHGI